MRSRGQTWLLIAALSSFAIAALHIAIAFVGAPAYLYFGGSAQLVHSGSSLPTIMTLVLAGVFLVFGLYALSGAGFIRRLPLLGMSLVVIGGLYTFRGLSAIDQTLRIVMEPGSLPFRTLLYSLASLATGCAYLIGTVQSWGQFHVKKSSAEEDKASRLEL